MIFRFLRTPRLATFCLFAMAVVGLVLAIAGAVNAQGPYPYPPQYVLAKSDASGIQIPVSNNGVVGYVPASQVQAESGAIVPLSQGGTSNSLSASNCGRGTLAVGGAVGLIGGIQCATPSGDIAWGDAAGLLGKSTIESIQGNSVDCDANMVAASGEGGPYKCSVTSPLGSVGRTYFVNPNPGAGSNANNGTFEYPFATLTYALTKAPGTSYSTIGTVILLDGPYSDTNPVVFPFTNVLGIDPGHTPFIANPLTFDSSWQTASFPVAYFSNLYFDLITFSYTGSSEPSLVFTNAGGSYTIASSGVDSVGLTAIDSSIGTLSLSGIETNIYGGGIGSSTFNTSDATLYFTQIVGTTTITDPTGLSGRFFDPIGTFFQGAVTSDGVGIGAYGSTFDGNLVIGRHADGGSDNVTLDLFNSFVLGSCTLEGGVTAFISDISSSSGQASSLTPPCSIASGSTGNAIHYAIGTNSSGYFSDAGLWASADAGVPPNGQQALDQSIAYARGRSFSTFSVGVGGSTTPTKANLAAPIVALTSTSSTTSNVTVALATNGSSGVWQFDTTGITFGASLGIIFTNGTASQTFGTSPPSLITVATHGANTLAAN
jgi:hypothetical protein